MKKFIAFTAIVAFFYSCNSGDRGELVGAKGKKWYPERPYGMTLVPGGSFIMGKSDDDFVAVNDAPTKTVTVRSFYMDETEITNSEYRQFVEWVRDSTVRLRLAIIADEMGETPGTGGVGEFAFIDQENAEMNAYDQYMYDNYFGMGDDFYAGRKVNNNIDLIWNTAEYPDEFYAEVMDTMYIPTEESYNGQRTIDVTKLLFQYTQMDIQAAARDQTKKTEKILL
jgi:gliding motility-associated lipoprotein GldK